MLICQVSNLENYIGAYSIIIMYSKGVEVSSQAFCKEWFEKGI